MVASATQVPQARHGKVATDASVTSNRGESAIRTPDQRVRVFVSSTLRELAAERAAAQSAITRLHLTPTMFELGARPHPPRDLYRSYLAQSEVFVGIYCRQYGWVTPGEEVSGLEDEYLLSAGMPKLIYVKAAAEREPRWWTFWIGSRQTIRPRISHLQTPRIWASFWPTIWPCC